MHQAMVEIITDRILNQFSSEAFFCQSVLDLDYSDWVAWKNNETHLKADDMQKLISLFSDYEWMLIQKIMRQAHLFPEKRQTVVSEYKRLKTVIAKTWLQEGHAVIELVNRPTGETSDYENGYKETFILKVSFQYDEWGYDDILEFYLPAKLQQQINASSTGLLAWVNENLAEKYM